MIMIVGSVLVGMGVRSLVTRLLTDGGSTVVIECRHCGYEAKPDADTCPECGSDELATYELTR
jgi:uncharacterized OB-fold protein